MEELLIKWYHDPQNEFNRCFEIIVNEIIQLNNYTNSQLNKFYNVNHTTILNVFNEDINIQITKDILPFIVPFVSILLMVIKIYKFYILII